MRRQHWRPHGRIRMLMSVLPTQMDRIRMKRTSVDLVCCPYSARPQHCRRTRAATIAELIRITRAATYYHHWVRSRASKWLVSLLWRSHPKANHDPAAPKQEDTSPQFLIAKATLIERSQAPQKQTIHDVFRQTHYTDKYNVIRRITAEKKIQKPSRDSTHCQIKSVILLLLLFRYQEYISICQQVLQWRQTFTSVRWYMHV